MQGGYGHSSVYDPNTESIYTHGGYKAFSANKYKLTDDLYRYEIKTRMWYVLLILFYYFVGAAVLLDQARMLAFTLMLETSTFKFNEASNQIRLLLLHFAGGLLTKMAGQ